jgi:hypothetical protein
MRFKMHLKMDLKTHSIKWQEIFTASLFWTDFRPKKPKFYKSITFKQRMFY